MAGEWIPIDCNLGTKPEVLEVAAATHEPVEVVVGRMVRLWSWAWHVTADGTIRVPRSMLATVAGGDESFWSAVERAGWLASTDDSVTIPGWGERFGNAAKRRLLDARAKSVRRLSASCPPAKRTKRGLEERRREEKREEEKREEHTTRHGEGSAQSDDLPAGWAATEWESFVSVWNRTARAKPWTPLMAPDGWVDLASSPGWLDKAREALARLPTCEFFRDPVAVTRFFAYVDRILAGEFDIAKQDGREQRRRQPAGGNL